MTLGGLSARWAGATAAQRERAQGRLAAVTEAEELFLAGGVSRGDADAAAARVHGVSRRQLQRWRNKASGLEGVDRLAALLDAPRAGRKRKGWRAPGQSELWRLWCTDYLRAEAPSAAAVHRRLAAIAGRKGWELPSLKAFQARTAAELSRPELVRARAGALPAMNLMPHQERTVRDLGPLAVLNGDGRRLDVLAEWPDGHVGRPCVWIWQDVWSRCVLAYRLGRTETGDLVRLTLHDALSEHGVPEAVLVDQTLAASSKWMTGGQSARKRWRSSAEEFPGVLRQLGIEYIATRVDRDAAGRGRGRSKPVERAFKDLASSVEGHPALAGAVTGRSTTDRPETHRMRAAELETVERLLAEAIREHNERPGRRTEIADGRSFREAYEAGVEAAAITRLTAAQAGLLLLAAEDALVRGDATIRLRAGRSEYGRNRYYSPALVDLAGQRIVARFDPSNLHADIQVFRRDGSYVAAAELIAPVGFRDSDAAALYERRRKAMRRAAEQGVAARRDMNELLEELDAAEAESAQRPLRPAPKPAVTKLATRVKPPAPAPEPRENATLAAVRKLRANNEI